MTIISIERDPHGKFKQFLLILGSIVILESIFFLIGLSTSLKWTPGLEEPPIYPVAAIVESNSNSSLAFFISILGINLFSHIGLLLFSVIHLGMGALIFLFVRVFYLGEAIGWFGNYEGSSVLNGFLIYGPHAIFELLATTIVAAVTCWVGISILKPDGMPRKNALFARCKKSLIAIPVVICLLLTSAVLETVIYVPKSFEVSQKALASEPKKQISDDQSNWRMTVPISWKEKNRGKMINSNLFTLSMDAQALSTIFIVTGEERGGIVTNEEFLKFFETNEGKENLRKMGITSIMKLEKVSINNIPAIKITGKGTIADLGKEPVDTTLFYLVDNKEAFNKTAVYTLTFWTSPKWANFSHPFIENAVDSFSIGQ